MRSVLFLGLAVAVLVGLFLLLAPEEATGPALTTPAKSAVQAATTTSDASAPTSPGVAASEPTEAQALKVFVLRVGQQGLLEGPAVIRVRQGDDIEIRISSDIDDELHLHGYDRHLHLRQGETAALRLEATLSGSFDYELHDRHMELGALEVLPR